jgi:hypothetical protein
MASPVVAGIAALHLARAPMSSARQIASEVRQDATAGMIGNLDATGSPNLLAFGSVIPTTAACAGVEYSGSGTQSFNLVGTGSIIRATTTNGTAELFRLVGKKKSRSVASGTDWFYQTEAGVPYKLTGTGASFSICVEQL